MDAVSTLAALLNDMLSVELDYHVPDDVAEELARRVLAQAELTNELDSVEWALAAKRSEIERGDS